MKLRTMCVASLALLASQTGCKQPNSETCVKADIDPGVGTVVDDGRAGFLQFEFNETASASALALATPSKTQCTALFDVPGTPASPNTLRVWTASHCVAGDLSRIKSVTGYLYSKAGLLEVPLMPLIPVASALTIMTAMSATGPGCLTSPVSKPLTNPTGDSKAQDVCFSWTDLLVFEAAVLPEEWASLSALVKFRDFRAGETDEVKAYFMARDAFFARRGTRQTVEFAWLPLAAHLEAKPESAVVITSSKRTFDFKSVDLKAFVADPVVASTRTPLPFGFRVVSQLERLKIRFEKGDSGSILTLGGGPPLLALHSVDDEPTSGGASVVALPSRRPSKAGANQNTERATTKNDRERDRSPDTGCGAGGA